MIGSTISHYKILDKLGEGGMGVVYKAEDTKLKRTVALKFLPPHLSASEQDKARFVQEAQAASALNHPNVCTIHDIQEHDGQMFIVMEFVNGQTLRERAKTQTLSFKSAIEIGIQIADGLAAAHEKGIVHRDIKPENIMVRKDGIAQIMDFGLAKLRGVSRLTKEGSTVGTAGYMSPEQVQGQDADHRSDIFSFGVLLYELITGRLPFKGVHETALAYEIVNVDAPPMSSVKPEIEPELDRIVIECLEKDPNERTQSVKQISIDLKRVKRESGRQQASRIAAARPIPKSGNAEQHSLPQVTQQKHLLWPIITGILTLLVFAALWLLWQKNNTSGLVARFAVALPADHVIEDLQRLALAISPDGTRFVYAANGKLYQKKTDSFDAEPIPGTEDASSPFFSPDGRWIGFFSVSQLKKVPVNGGTSVVLADIRNNRGAAWAKDGTIVFSPGGRTGLFRIRDDGEDIRPLTTIDTAQNERTHRWPQCLPDGKTVIFTLGTLGSPDYYEDATIVAVNMETGARKVLLKGASTAYYIPPGYLLYSHNGTLFAVEFDLDHLEAKGSSFPVVDHIAEDVTTGANHYAISENGTLAFLAEQSNANARMFTLINQRGTTAVLPAAGQSYVDQRLSPDGHSIAVAIQSGKDFDIWVYDIRRNTMSKLTFGGSNRSPVWSPDGRRIAYSNNTAVTNNGTGNASVIIIPSDGSGTPEKILLDSDRSYVNSWSHDGSNLFVTIPHSGMGWDIVVLPLKGDRKQWMFLSTKFDESAASLSPDGKWMAYVSNETGSAQVYIRPFPRGDGKWQLLSESALRVLWSADGKTLYYDNRNSIMQVPITLTSTLVVGQPKPFVENYRRVNVESGVSFDILPDGQNVLVTWPKESGDSRRQINFVLNWFDEINKNMASAK